MPIARLFLAIAVHICQLSSLIVTAALNQKMLPCAVSCREHLEAALDRFAQFFIAPLISADGVDREINAVDSENGKNLQL